MMDVNKEEINDVVVIRAIGAIKIGESTEQFSSFLERSLNDQKKVVINLEGINYMDSMGLGELIGHLTRFEEKGGLISMVKPSRRVETLLQLSGLHEVFTIFETEEEAIQKLC